VTGQFRSPRAIAAWGGILPLNPTAPPHGRNAPLAARRIASERDTRNEGGLRWGVLRLQCDCMATEATARRVPNSGDRHPFLKKDPQKDPTFEAPSHHLG
jgi:hypothetical protein